MQVYRKKYLFIVIVLTATYFMACAPQKSYKVLSFLFDGVPEPTVVEATNLQDTTVSFDSTRSTPKSNVILAAQFVFHSPYQNKECASCHDQKTSDKTIEPEPALCYKCHEDFNENYMFLHGPVGGGYCTSCHNPHKAKLGKLLLRSTQQLCIFCHDSSLVFNNQFHKTIKKDECTDCHNPHGSDNRYMMQNGACYKCHDNYNKTLKYIHGPVAGGYCSTCHSPHINQSENLLLRQGEKLCFDCHNEKLIFNNDVHKNNDKDCTGCHDPHGGENRLFTKPK